MLGKMPESLKHELCQKFLRKKKKILAAKIWAHVHRNLFLETCMVAGNAMWQTIFQRLLRHLTTCQEAGGCTLYMQPIRLNAPFQVQNRKVMWFVCVRPVAESVVYVSGSHLRWKLCTVGP